MTEPVQGPSYTWAARALALLAMVLVAQQAWQVWQGLDASPDSTTWIFLGLGAAALLYGLAHIWMARTLVDDTHIRQHGLFQSEVEIARLSQVKLIYIPYLTWLIAPRLVVRSGGLRSWVFHAADRAVLQRFWQLAHDAQLPPSAPTASSDS